MRNLCHEEAEHGLQGGHYVGLSRQKEDAERHPQIGEGTAPRAAKRHYPRPSVTPETMFGLRRRPGGCGRPANQAQHRRNR
jgi:hypothetical protein